MIRDILCKIGIHSWNYNKKVSFSFGGMTYYRKCKRCLLSQKKVDTNYDFRVRYITGELMQPKMKWKWKSMEMTKEDLRELRLRKLGL